MLSIMACRMCQLSRVINRSNLLLRAQIFDSAVIGSITSKCRVQQSIADHGEFGTAC